jgi:hypothetical protein
MLFDKRNKKIIKAIWIVVSLLVIVSMILLYIPLGY